MKSTTQIGLELGCAGQTVRNILKSLGVEKDGKYYSVDEETEKKVIRIFNEKPKNRYGDSIPKRLTHQERLIGTLQAGFEMISDKLGRLTEAIQGCTSGADATPAGQPAPCATPHRPQSAQFSVD
jgi:hypothetical protein